MKQWFLLTFAIFLSLTVAAQHYGSWKAFMSYHDIQEIAEGQGTIYVLASNNLYSYHKVDNSITTYDKTKNLSDGSIAHIAWCEAAGKLLIVYANQNIDILKKDGSVVNLSDYYNKSMAADKTVYAIHIQDKEAFLSTGFGIIDVDVDNAVVRNTYQLGFKVDYCYTEDNYIYAASSTHGLYQGNFQSNLQDKTNWKRVGEYQKRQQAIDDALLATVQALNPGGPTYNNFGFIRFHNGKLYTVGGGYTMLKEQYLPACVQVLQPTEETWTIYPDNLKEETGHTVVDFNTVSVDPKNENHVFAGGRTGLIEFMDAQYHVDHTYENSPLRGAALVSPTNKNYTLVHGSVFDDEGALWCLNSCSSTSSILQYKQGEWISHHKEELVKDGHSLNHLTSPFFDSRQLLWFVNNHYSYPSVHCYQPSTGAINTYYTFVNQDGNKVNVGSVRCAMEDKEGNIWIGTDVGPLVLEPAEFNSAQPVFQQIKIPRNDGTNYADYLLADIDITCMAVDGAGRKWMGTDGKGLYLISSDNMQQVQHFEATNSKLLSNHILSLAIDDATGTLYIGTDQGLCAYSSDAITPAETMTDDTVYAYPNPVNPNYTGPITITGLTLNADIKITTINGTVVAEGRSQGGLFLWNGQDKKGRRVASGIYMVHTATADGSKGVVCKIAIVN